MTITGHNLIGFTTSGTNSNTFHATNPANMEALPVHFHEATAAEIDQAIQKAEAAFEDYRQKSGTERADFLDAIADEILHLGDALLQRCHQESGLPLGRLTGERGRTMNQLRLFASLVREGSWVDARIDHAIPDRTPFPKVDIRQMQRPLGPVGIFGASNFPLAFSVAGGDTASALAAGCTIVVKGHPAHPGTSELVGRAIVNAARKTGMPDGVFSMVQGPSVDVGLALVRHPLIKAIGFTGSFRGGKAIFDEANRRPEPIPVYAEMGSTNPVFILPGALKERKEQIAQGLTGSVTLGVGQFCTNPGLTVTMESEDAQHFASQVKENFGKAASAAMLTTGIQDSYDKGVINLANQEGVDLLATGVKEGSGAQGVPNVLQTTAQSFLNNEVLEHEVFGPSTLLISATDKSEILAMARGLEGHLTATLQATEADLHDFADLVQILERKVGRLIINGFPTGVEVCPSMVHGGPFPATTDSRMTSVGTGAITRFSRPVCYQNFPQFLLPDELKDENPLGIARLVDGVLAIGEVVRPGPPLRPLPYPTYEIH